MPTNKPAKKPKANKAIKKATRKKRPLEPGKAKRSAKLKPSVTAKSRPRLRLKFAQQDEPAERSKAPLVRVAVAVSLDGYLADLDGGVGWLNPYFSPEMDFDRFMRSIGAMVMGRKTYVESLNLGLPPGTTDMPCVVLTHQPLVDPPTGIEACSGDLVPLVERLRLELAESGKDIWHMGGGAAIDAFRAQGLIDRYELNVMPITLGCGIPLFPPHSRSQESLRLTHSRTLKNGVAELWYEPIRR